MSEVPLKRAYKGPEPSAPALFNNTTLVAGKVQLYETPFKIKTA